VYEYQVTQYNRETGEGDLFVDYINTFLKLKAETIGYAGWVQVPKTRAVCEIVSAVMGYG